MSVAKKLALVASAALSVSLLATSPAGAAGAAHPHSTAGLSAHVAAASHGASAVPGAKALHVTPATASTLGAGGYTGARVLTAGVTFKMPSFSCKSSSDSEWLLPGLWLFDGSGNLISQIDVNFNCNGGTKLQESVICITGGSCDTSLTPNPGDVMEAVYLEDGSTAYGTIYDKTQGTFAQATGTAGGPDAILFGDLSGASFGVAAVPTFTKIAFNNASLNGYVLADWSPAALSLKNGSDTQIKGSPVSTASFTTKFVHNN